MTFRKVEEKGRRHCTWTALRGKRTQIPGPFMAAGKGLPHDLAQYVIEAAADYRNGFWGLLAAGATYKSTGRKRTRPGRAIIAANRKSLIGSEQLAGHHLERWRAMQRSPVTDALDTAFEQWRSLRVAEVLVFEWPSPKGIVLVRQ